MGRRMNRHQFNSSIQTYYYERKEENQKSGNLMHKWIDHTKRECDVAATSRNDSGWWTLQTTEVVDLVLTVVIASVSNSRLGIDSAIQKGGTDIKLARLFHASFFSNVRK